jgi:DNA-binding beta-propeller fold protein YncE
VANENTAWHGVDTVYFADRDNNLIRKLVPNGDDTFAVVTVAGTAPTPGADPCGPLVYYPGRVDGPSSSAKFRGACGLALSADQRYLYVAERDNNVVRCIDLMDEIVGTYAGVLMVGQKLGGFADGPASEARFNGCSQIDYDNDGNLYVADRFNHVIRKITPSSNPMVGDTVSTYAGVPMQSGRRSGPASKCKFYEPWGLSIDRENMLMFIGDTGNSRVAVIGAYKDIWPAFAERLNKARIYEYQQLMAVYQDYYRGEQMRSPTMPKSYASEGTGERSAPDGTRFSDAPRSTD